MLSFGLMTIINVRQAQRRVHITNVSSVSATNRNNQQRLKKTDHYLLLMLFVQVILFGVFVLPQNIQKFISYAQANQIQSALNTAIGNFIFNFFLLFAYLANGMSFYIYTLFGGSVFRDEIWKLAQGVCRIF
jgi:Na+/proline symporter